MARLPQGRRTNSNRSKLIIPLILMASAVVLLAAAFAQPKEKAPDEWVQLNREVGAALQMQGEPEAGAQKAELTDKPKDSSSGMPSTPPGSVQAEVRAGEAGGDEELPSSGKLDINRATAEQLDTLKGIGPAKAQAIIADREQNGPFSSAEDLLRVKGIGSKLLAGIKDSIVASP
ncbi:competence protein ComEA [Paenibacillus sp. BK033]|uniref:ComEA family DNA-binding protein n=1 Tax=Paenibacillus sp. BK033 TaxID=2512133 RepID=UPI0010DD2729|nr:ComEA family DNA-binding protein [Paenibacillus sp. BK033]TCN01537.1 competence protein ComEA [Paenibacillus sp. BK033]